MGYDHWYKQREDELKALKCGTKTYGLAEEEQGWVWVNKLKAKQVHKKELLSLAKFHKFHNMYFPMKVKFVQTHRCLYIDVWKGKYVNDTD